MRKDLLVIFSLLSINSQGQVTGNKMIGVDFPNLATAVNTLNTQGVGSGGAILTLPPGYTETAPPGGFTLGSNTLNASTSVSNPITIQKGSGSGSNPQLIAYTGSSPDNDAIFKILGTDYVTIDGIDVQESASNANSTRHLMEWGYAILKLNSNDGSQNINIVNCKITLDKTNLNTKGIYAANNDGNILNSFTVTSISGINSNIHINNCNISNCYVPVSVSGYTSNSGFYDTGLEIGTTKGNTLSNFGGSSAATFGITVTGQNNIHLENNSVVPGPGSTLTVTGINITNFCTGDIVINNNTLSLFSGSATGQLTAILSAAAVTSRLDITNNTIQNCDFSTATTGPFYGIYEGGAQPGATVTISGNSITGLTYSNSSNAGSGNVMLIYKPSGNADNVLVNNNSITNNTITGTNNNLFSAIDIEAGNSVQINTNLIFNNNFNGSGTTGQFYGIYSANNVISVNSNQIYNNKINKPSHTGGLYGIYNNQALGSETYSNNIIYGLQSISNSTIVGIYATGASSSRQITLNTIYDLTSTGGTVNGIYLDKSTTTVSRNKEYNLASSNSSGIVNGMYVAGGTNVNIVNNLIGDLKATGATGLNAISGISINGGNVINVYFNTVYLNASSSSSTTFGSSALFVGSTVPTVTLKNNILINKSVPGPTGGFSTSFRYVSFPGSGYNAQSNTNLFYAGQPSSNTLIYGEGISGSAANPQSTLSSYKSYMAGRDGSSVTEDPPFVNTNGTNVTYLHMSTMNATFTESRGVPVSGITDDFDGEPRDLSKPDIGADEFTGSYQSLPIHLLSFTGERKENNIVLQWATSYELNFRGFYIERSDDGIHYSEIGFIERISNTNHDVPLNYTFMDHATSGKAYYYLKEVDWNGRIELSQIIVINNNSSQSSLCELFPNPAKGKIFLKIQTLIPEPVTISLHSIRGEKIKEWYKLVNGSNTIEMDVSGISSGAYIINVSGVYSIIKRRICIINN